MKPIHLVFAATCFFSSCEKHETSSTATSTPSQEVSEALKSVLGAPPKGPTQEIHVIRATAKPGDEITIGGRIMGNIKPFVEGRAVFTLADPSILTACNDNPGDNCKTPWDNCCDTKEQKLIGLATVQIVGADGRALKENLEGVGGLKKLGHVTVTGKVAEGSTSYSLVVNASAIQATP